VRFKMLSANSSDTYLQRLKQAPAPDIVLLDIDISDPKIDGLNLAKQSRKLLPDCVILMFSSLDDPKTIVTALNNGADDFLSKKSDKGELALRIVNSYTLALLKRGTVHAKGSRETDKLGAGASMKLIAGRVPRILNSAVTAVHIHGESGTGKEVVVDLFANSLGKAALVRVNCGAIAPTLLESELFGHVKGAFTGAAADKRGFIEGANGGWIFLDEVATLSSNAQTALLRVLENQEIIRVGDNAPRKVNVKFLSATNEVLADLVKAGKFRRDLWQRLCEVEIALPPLRERPKEIEELIGFFLQAMPGGPYKISRPAMDILRAAPWSDGNIRQLRNCLRAMTEYQVENKLLTPLSIPARVWEDIGEDVSRDGSDAGDNLSSTIADKFDIRLACRRDNLSYDYLADLLLLELTKILASSGKISLRSMAKSIAMSRSTLSTRLKSLVERKIVDLPSLAELVGITDKGTDQE